MKPKSFRILVCGGRDWSNGIMVSGCLDGFRNEYHHKGRPIVIVQGGATGADFLAKQYAIKNDIPYEEFVAEWNKYGRAAGHKRNTAMLDSGIDIVIAFPGGRGTQDTVGKAEKRGIRVWKPARAELYDIATD